MESPEPSSEADFALARRAVERGWITEEVVESALIRRDEDPDRPLRSFLPLTDEQFRELSSTVHREIPAEAAEAMRDPGNRVGRFWRESLLGTGGMARVFRAWDGDLHRWVALKFLKSFEDRRARDYFQREAQLAAGLDHPNIAKIYEVGEHEGAPYIAMQYVDGPNLRSAAEEMGLSEKLQAVTRIARAVEHAHRERVIHRDLKPGNVMVDREGRVYVMDFGLAKVRELEDSEGPQMSLGGSRVLVGTPSYMAPEQARGEAGPQSDVWGLGAILYELVTGGPPFTGATTAQVLARVVRDEPVRPGKRAPGTPPDVEAIVLRCLEKDPGRRYASAAELVEDLERLANREPLRHARPITFRYLLGKKIRRQPALSGLLAGLVLLGVVALGLGARLWYDRAVKAEREKTRQEAQAAYEEGKTFLLKGLDLGAAPALEQSIVLLTEAADGFRRLPDESFRLVSSLTGIALAREKLAYAGSREGRVYRAAGDEILWRRTGTGDDISQHPVALGEGEIRATDIADPRAWAQARARYGEVLDLLLDGAAESSERAEAMALVSSARSAGYFFICDHLRTGADCVARARRALEMVRDLAGPDGADLANRYRDAVAKLHFLDVLAGTTPRPEEDPGTGGAEDMRIVEDLVPYHDSLARRDPGRIDMIVLHCTELPTLADAREYAEKIHYESSGTGNCGHYYADRDGSVHRYVHHERVAHHVKGHNTRSIGIEIVNRGRFPDWYSTESQVPTEEYPEVQIAALLRLLARLKAELPGVTELRRHSDLDTRLIPAEDDPEKTIRRKIDPGPLLPWGRVLEAWRRMDD